MEFRPPGADRPGAGRDRAVSAPEAERGPAGRTRGADWRGGVAARLPSANWLLSGRRLAGLYAAFAIYAGAVAAFSGPGEDRIWGIWAVLAYAAAAVVAAIWRDHGRTAALVASLAGALILPILWLARYAPPTSDVQFISRSAELVLRYGTVYLSPAQLAQLGVAIAYNPYLPLMAAFGLPRALGLPGVLGDPRVWLTLVSLTLFVLAFRFAGRRDPMRCALFAVATPVVAFPLVLGATDPPVLALICLALALVGATSRQVQVWLAAVAVGVACAMKYTAWPALPVFAALLTARDGARRAVGFTAVAAATAAVLLMTIAPASLGSPGALVQNTVAFPLGMTRARTPAASPLPGHLLATTGPVGQAVALGLLIAAAVGVGVSLVVWPPRTSGGVALRLAIGLTLMFALSPATRFGYFLYPAGLFGWLLLTREQRLARKLPALATAGGLAEVSRPAGAGRRG